MFQDVIQLANKNRLIKKPSRHYLEFLLNVLGNMEANKPLYSFTLPGLILGTIGLYMNINSVQELYLDGNFFDLKNTILATLLTLFGVTIAFIGFLFHSISGLIKYNESKF
jgi:hypothetical protein